jgi:hypothetical protein
MRSDYSGEEKPSADVVRYSRDPRPLSSESKTLLLTAAPTATPIARETKAEFEQRVVAELDAKEHGKVAEPLSPAPIATPAWESG